MLTTESVRIALKQIYNEPRYSDRRLARQVGLVNRELNELGHHGHQVAVERIAPYFGDPGVLRWSLWCETCHVAHHVLMDTPFSRRDPVADEELPEAEPRSKRRWILWPPTPGLMQRLLG